MAQHKDWFSVDKDKRAARVRNYQLPFVLREALANALDANATEIELTLSPSKGTRSNRENNRAFDLLCKDNGCGCDDPEILRRVGSSTSDLDAEKRGRFGQGLIDLLAICDTAELLTKDNRIQFDRQGCQVSKVRKTVEGLVLTAVIRHSGEGFQDLPQYFASLILPSAVSLTFNGMIVHHRSHIREILDLQLPTIIYDDSLQRIKSYSRSTNVKIYDIYGTRPMIHELGVPVDTVPWDLPYDIDVAQKVPLDMERCMLPEAFKERLVSLLVHPMSDLYERFMKNTKRVPTEILNDRKKAKNLTPTAREQTAKTMYNRSLSDIGRQNPFDPQDRGRRQELELLGVLSIDMAHAPEGMKGILEDCPTVETLHNERCKAHFTFGVLPEVTERQDKCISIYGEIASALLDREVMFTRFQAPVKGESCGLRAAYNPLDRSIGLNIQVSHLWKEPMGVESIGVIVHECAHEAVEGHALEFQREIQRLAGKLAVWIGSNPERWKDFQDRLR